MLCRIKIPFESRKGLSYDFFASSVMQGIMMESIPGFYAEKMHSLALLPYSQYSVCLNGNNVWTVSALSREAYENIITPLLALKSAEVRHKSDTITFGSADTEILSYEQLLAENAAVSGKSDLLKLEFLTPTAFKSSGRYIILPTLRLIFQSLARRFDTFFGIEDNNYDDLFNEIDNCVTVSDYELSSSSFSLEGVRIPSFKGSLTLRMKGETEFRSYIRMLCRFAEFSGIGIKTAIGMGSVKYSYL